MLGVVQPKLAAQTQRQKMVIVVVITVFAFRKAVFQNVNINTKI